MTKTDQIVLSLVRSALGADCGVDSGLFRDVNWDEVMDVAFDLRTTATCPEADGDKVSWGEVVPLLRKMGIWRFFCAVCGVCRGYLGLRLEGIPEIERDEELERRIMEDVLHPEFAEVKPEGMVRVLWFKMRRWWFNRWKHPLVYDEWLVPMFLTLAWSKVRRVKTIGD